MASKHAQQRRPSTQLPLEPLLHESRQPHRISRWSSYLLHREGIGIRLAHKQDHVDEVVQLLARMYGQRGYQIPKLGLEPLERIEQITLEACQLQATVGTMTVAFDTLKAQEHYGREIASFHTRNARLCEFTRLAVDTGENAKQTLAYLFHLAFIFAYRIHAATDLFIEVNPRHALFYCRKLGFEQIGEEKICARVNAPAVLLHRSLAAVAEDVLRFGGVRTPENNTFYALWLTQQEENEMVREIERRLAAYQALSCPLAGCEDATASPARSA